MFVFADYICYGRDFLGLRLNIVAPNREMCLWNINLTVSVGLKYVINPSPARAKLITLYIEVVHVGF